MKNIFTILTLLILFANTSCVKEPTPSNNTSNTNCTARQCSAKAASTGNQCKNTTTNCNGRCHLHQ